MKKFIAFAALSLVTTLSVASNGYCDGRKTQAEVQRCYVNAVQMQNGMIKNIVQQVYASPKLTDEDKRTFAQEHQNWVNWVNKACSNNVCMYNEMVKHRNQANAYYVQYAQ